MFLVGGENLIDFIQTAPDGGYPTYRAVPGGAPYNVAKALARQEVETGYLTPFSHDTLGLLLADHLAGEAHVTLLAERSAAPTSLAVVSLKDGQASYQFYRERTAERDVTPAGLQNLIPEAATGVFVGSLALTDGADAEAWAALLLAAQGNGLFTAIDPNIRAAFIHDRDSYLARLSRVIAKADLVKLSDEDIGWLRPNMDPRAALRSVAEETEAGLVVLTMGGEGAYALCAGEEIHVPVHPVRKLVDTVGAGDTFMGTLIAQTQSRGYKSAGALASLTPAEAAEILAVAAKAAALNCEQEGCNPPRLADLEG